MGWELGESCNLTAQANHICDSCHKSSTSAVENTGDAAHDNSTQTPSDSASTLDSAGRFCFIVRAANLQPRLLMPMVKLSLAWRLEIGKQLSLNPFSTDTQQIPTKTHA